MASKNKRVRNFLKRTFNKAKDVTSSAMALPSIGATKVKGYANNQKIIGDRAEKNVRKQYGGGGIGRREMVGLKVKEISRLKKMLKERNK